MVDAATLRRRARREVSTLVRRGRRLRPESYVRRRRAGAFAVAHVGRCGSTVLGDLLGQHPSIRWDGESYGQLFHEMVEHGRRDDRRDVVLSTQLARQMRSHGPGWFGFDYLLAHLLLTSTSVEAHADGLRAAGFTRFVVLRRLNQLRGVASARVADTSGVWHSPVERAKRGEPMQAILDVSADDVEGNALVRRLRRQARFYDDLATVHAHDAVLDLTFEADVEEDPKVGYRRVVDFLGLAPHEPEVRLRRLNRRPLREMIQNHDDVAAALAGTEFEWMLDA